MPGLENVLNIHPLFVHFPVALTPVALLFEVLYIFFGKDRWRLIASALIYVSATASVAAVITGYIAADTLGHDAPGHDLVHVHRDIMVWFTAILVTLAILNAILSSESLRGRFPIWTMLIRPVTLLAATVILVIGADRGGQLVFQHGMGVKMETVPIEGQDHSTHQHQPSEPSAPSKQDTLKDHHVDHEHEH